MDRAPVHRVQCDENQTGPGGYFGPTICPELRRAHGGASPALGKSALQRRAPDVRGA